MGTHSTSFQIFKNPFKSFAKGRNVSLDLLKLFAILFVILDNSLQRWVVDAQNLPAYNFIFLTQMPLFFFISGYLFVKNREYFSTIESLLFYLLKLLISFIVPFLIFAVINSIVTGWDFRLLLTSFTNPQYSLWFLWVLFWIQAFLAISIYLSKKISFIFTYKVISEVLSFVFFGALMALAFLIHIKTGMFDAELMVYYSLFFIVGLLANLFKKYYQKFINYCSVFILFNISIFVFTIIMFLHPNVISEAETIPNTIARIIGSFASITCCFSAVSFLQGIRILEKVSRIGQLSLEFYATHLLLFMIPLLKLQVEFNSFANYMIFIGLYLMTIVLSFAVIMLFKSFFLTDLLFYGKTSKEFSLFLRNKINGSGEKQEKGN